MWSVVYLAMSALLFLQGWYETYVFAFAFVGISIYVIFTSLSFKLLFCKIRTV